MIARALGTARLLGLGWVLHFKLLSRSAFDGVLGVTLAPPHSRQELPA